MELLEVARSVKGEGGPAKHYSKQFVIDGNEFLIIETDNVLWHLEQ